MDAFFSNALSGQDQLRQRVIFALSEIIVIAMNKNTNGNEIVPWLVRAVDDESSRTFPIRQQPTVTK